MHDPVTHHRAGREAADCHTGAHIMIRRIALTLGRCAGVAVAAAALCSTSVGTAAARPLPQMNSLTAASNAPTMGAAASRSGYIVASS
jgi:hypothetical protein